jgi:NAD(P) transhydrogenase
MYSIGRVGATGGLNLEPIGLQPDERGRLQVNDHFQTSVPHIYAVGDVVGFPALASTSMQQGRHASCHAFGLACETSSHLLPYGIYTIPEISMVGRNEDELTRNGIPYEIGVARYRGRPRPDSPAISSWPCRSETRRLLGVHVIDGKRIGAA